jgi:hypothetical protein
MCPSPTLTEPNLEQARSILKAQVASVFSFVVVVVILEQVDATFFLKKKVAKQISIENQNNQRNKKKNIELVS